VRESRAAARGPWRTLGAVTALVGGLALGIALHGSADAVGDSIVRALAVIGHVWVASLQMAVLPLMISLTLVAIVGARRDPSIGTLGLKTLLLYVAMLLSAGALALAATAPALSVYRVDAETAAAFRSATTSLPAAASQVPSAPTSLGSLLTGLIPTNVFQSAASGEILPILLFTVFFALAASRLPAEPHELLRRLSQAIADAMMVLVGWILRFLPVGVFALSVEFAFRVGVRVTGVIAAYVVLVSGIALLATLLLYPVSTIFGGVSLARFSRATAPAQIVAATTRSSIASLPALVEGGRRHLDLPASATGFVLPMSVATFKLSRTLSSLVELLFLGHIFHLSLGPSQVASFFATQFVLSFSTAGIPSAGSIRSLPAYLVAGVPLEAVLMLNAIDTIPDIFNTIANVTADMSVAVILSRRERRSVARAEPQVTNQ
jgi:Na+/H+-dicarboxylate symporter